MQSKTRIALAVNLCCALWVPSSWAQSATAPAPAQAPAPAPTVIAAADGTGVGSITQLGPVTISATRTERQVDDVPATVTVIPAAAIERSGARNLKDLLRDEIDVTVRAVTPRFTAALSSAGRAGNEGINIRGLEGNQVLILVDGIRVPNAFSFGAFATGRADFLNLDAAQSVEILRGPASTQFGSDGLAGALSLRTLVPADLLKDGRDFGGYARLGYASVDASKSAALAAAARIGAWQVMLLASHREGRETANQGQVDVANPTRTTPNPLKTSSPALLAKAVYAFNPQHSVQLSAQAQQSELEAELLSARALPPLGATSVLGLTAQDKVQRSAASFEHQYRNAAAPLVQKVQTRVFLQDADVRQFTAEDRNTAADRTRDNSYGQKVFGLSTQWESNFSREAWTQRLSYGVDASRTEIAGVRSGTVPPAGESFPVKPFPDTKYTLVGAFLQDEIELGAISVIPALRFDRYKLEPSAEGYTGGAVVTLSDQAVTPRLGVVWRLAPAFAPYAQWAKGFRAPTPDQVNNGFSNLAFGYISVGNSNLQAERADSVELGVRGKGSGALQGLRWSAAAFDNRYTNFISQEVVGGAGTAADPTVFKYINAGSARIRGLEVRAAWRIDSMWSVNGGAAVTHGNSKSSNAAASATPLNSIEPARVVLGLRYDAGTVSAQATALHTEAKARDRIATIVGNTGPVPAFAVPASTVLDLSAQWKPLAALTLTANLNNALNSTYWRWSDARGLADSNPIKDAYTAPGRNVQVSARYNF